MGSDEAKACGILSCLNFNPRSPHGERPSHNGSFRHPCRNFNPRSPHGERQHWPLPSRSPHRFQSTLPAWGATILCIDLLIDGVFQSTLPAWGATASAGVIPLANIDFNPRSPHGERHDFMANQNNIVIFQSTLPAWGAT